MTPTISREVKVREVVDQGTSTALPYFIDKTIPIPISYHATVPETKISICGHIGNFLSQIKFEIACFSLTFSLIVHQVSSTSMILEKVCLAEYSKDICENLQNYTEIKSEMERAATNYQLIHTLIRTVPGAVLSLFIGSWSDKYSRKLPLQVAVTGAALEAVGSSICAYYIYSRVEYYFIPAAFMGCFGGIASIGTVLYSYASESVSLEKRTMKYAVYEISIGLAKPIGVAVGGWIFKLCGYVIVFLIAACGLIISVLWVTFVLPETRGLDNNDPWKMKAKQLLSCETLKENVSATVKNKSRRTRIKIALMITSICILHITTGASTATSEVNFMFTHHQFNWGNTEYSTISSLYLGLTLISLALIVPFLKRFKTQDSTIGVIGSSSSFARLTVTGLAWKPVVYHIANVFGLIQGLGIIAGRSCLSKMIPKEDLGKVFSCVAIAEAILPIVVMIVFAQTFNFFLDIFPGTPYLLLATITLLPFSAFLWTSFQPKQNYEDIPGKNEWKRNDHDDQNESI